MNPSEEWTVIMLAGYITFVENSHSNWEIRNPKFKIQNSNLYPKRTLRGECRTEDSMRQRTAELMRQTQLRMRMEKRFSNRTSSVGDGRVTATCRNNASRQARDRGRTPATKSGGAWWTSWLSRLCACAVMTDDVFDRQNICPWAGKVLTDFEGAVLF